MFFPFHPSFSLFSFMVHFGSYLYHRLPLLLQLALSSYLFKCVWLFSHFFSITFFSPFLGKYSFQTSTSSYFFLANYWEWKIVGNLSIIASLLQYQFLNKFLRTKATSPLPPFSHLYWILGSDCAFPLWAYIELYLLLPFSVFSF